MVGPVKIAPNVWKWRVASMGNVVNILILVNAFQVLKDIFVINQFASEYLKKISENIFLVWSEKSVLSSLGTTVSIFQNGFLGGV